MADTTGNTRDTGAPLESGAGPAPRRAGWRHIGPGIVVAATGVGAGDLVATLIAGSNFGYTLLWAAIVGCLVKISLAEAWAAGRGRPRSPRKSGSG
ncbi:Nramp family divalent metal transporter, partial [Streptomyces sp. NPDC127100]|uniref:Nramp family divalent metal transporter n=1 Tax=Streptomyces sp. NPDC127100 TaxID=3347138 RepID=UPI00365C5ECD